MTHGQLSAQVLTDWDIAHACQRREDTVVGLQVATPAEMRQDLEDLHVEVTVKDKQAWVKCRVALAPEPIDLHTP